MHITSGLSPASGEMLDTNINFFGEAEQCTYFAVDNCVPESSHTVEIEYVYEQELQESTTSIPTDDVITPVQVEETIAPIEIEEAFPKQQTPRPKSADNKKIRTKHKPEKMTVEEDTETDLTNLTWLQNITNIMQVPQFPILPMSPNPQTKTPANTRLQKFNQTIAKCQKDFMENKEEYQNTAKKPLYSYSTLICMAMRYNNDKMTLSAIYSWIRENFKYYRNADPTWQNSIRHNLSLNKVFVKVARSKHEPGKGGFWKLDLAHLEGNKRISNRPHKKKKGDLLRSDDPQKVETNLTEENIAVANIPPNIEVIQDVAATVEQAVTLHLPEFDLNMGLDTNIGANVIVEPVAPPPLMVEDDLSNLLLNPTDWADLQLDMLDNYLDSCFKFPKTEEIRGRWFAASSRSEKQHKHHWRVYSRHFSPDCFVDGNPSIH